MANNRKASRNSWKSLGTILILLLVLAALLAVAVGISKEPGPTQPPTEPSTGISGPTEPSSEPTEPSSEPTEPSSEPTQPPTEPPVVKESTVTIAATGDMLMHLPVINRYKTGDTYNFDGVFTRFREYVLTADFAFANLETTLAGPDFVHDKGNVGYSGYPQFNCPDNIIDGLKNAGFDCILTANNHSYDTRTVGLRRTMEVIANRGLSHLGTQTNAEAPDYMLVEKDGVKLGLMCYTYEDNADPNIKAPNSHTMEKADAPLLSTFNYHELPAFYEEIEKVMAEMKKQGVQGTVIFIHWGEEYKLVQNSRQTAIAQKLCDLGVDVIIGGHPHVVQPVELLTSTADPDHKTVCLYSMGNALSNQRLGNLSNVKTAHTEDGVLFSVTFAKYSDGTVILESAELLPLWVNSKYEILPLDEKVADWQTKFSVSDTDLVKMKASLERTNAIVGEGMAAVDSYLKNHVAETEARLNVAK